ncbi:MAG: limonene-1,2-epoxide hydrolase family protein [Sphingorhabdus sp.]
MANIDIVRNFIDLWNANDLDAILAAMAPDCFYHNIPWEPVVGHAAIRERLSAFLGKVEAIDWQLPYIAEAADGTVLTERIDRFLIGGQWKEVAVMGTFELRDGKIVRWRDYFDSVQAQAALAL